MIKRLVLLLLAAALFAQTPAEEIDERFIKQTILFYNDGIVEMARTSRVDHLDPFVEKEHLQTMLLWVKAWHDSNLFMDARIKTITVEDINLTGENLATVKARERWDYRYIQIVKKEEVWPLTQVEYENLYTLVKEKDRWKIRSVKVLSEKQERRLSPHSPDAKKGIDRPLPKL